MRKVRVVGPIGETSPPSPEAGLFGAKRGVEELERRALLGFALPLDRMRGIELLVVHPLATLSEQPQPESCRAIARELVVELPIDGVCDFLPAITVDSLDLARHIAVSTAAILPAVHGMVAADLRDNSLVVLDFREPWMQTSYQLLQRRDGTPSPAARAFVEELRAVEAELDVDSLPSSRPATRPAARSARQAPPVARGALGRTSSDSFS